MDPVDDLVWNAGVEKPLAARRVRLSATQRANVKGRATKDNGEGGIIDLGVMGQAGHGRRSSDLDLVKGLVGPRLDQRVHVTESLSTAK